MTCLYSGFIKPRDWTAWESCSLPIPIPLSDYHNISIANRQPIEKTPFSTGMNSEESSTPQYSPTCGGSSANPPSLLPPSLPVNSELDKLDAIELQSTITTIQTNFQKSLNTEFKPGRASQDELIRLTEQERNIAEAAIVPQDLDDFIKKVISLYLFKFA